VAGTVITSAPLRPALRPLVGTARLPATLLAVTVLAQIAYPLTSGDVRDGLTIATVLLWAATSLTHAAVTRGTRYAAALLVIAGGIGLLAEVIGTATGVPFGAYHYVGGLGPQWAGVPLIIPLAWVMMAYPALLVGRRLGRPVLIGAAALAAWDLFLDPQMVAAGHWTFTGGGPRLNGIPLVNTLGWLLVAFLIMIALAAIPTPDRPTDDRIAYALYLWTYASSVLAAAAFFHRPGVALAGGLVMGVPTLLLARALRRQPGPAR
jgi:uncharacterized membrane protein